MNEIRTGAAVVRDSTVEPVRADGVPPNAAGSGPDVTALLRAALAAAPITILTTDGTPTFALPGAAPIHCPADSKIILGKTGRLDGDHACIILDRLLQHGVDYRSILNAAFEKLKVGGCLIVVVPSQILYERKLQLPSRLPTRYAKFYTPSVLVAELEEAIDPFAYRVRHVGDLDANYMSGDLGTAPDGQSDILAVIEKIETPPWGDLLTTEDAPTYHSHRPTDLLKPAPTSPYVVVAPDDGELRDILVVQVDHRGDYVMGGDARQLIRTIWPDARITYVCSSWNEADARAAGTVDDVVVFDFFHEDGSAKAKAASFEEQGERFRTRLAGRRFDLALDLRLDTDTRELLKVVDARRTAGFDLRDDFPWLDIRMPAVDPDNTARVWQKFIPASDLLTCGEHDFLKIRVKPEHCIERDGRAILWGPYIDLPAGRYEVRLLCDCAEPTEVRWDFCAGPEIFGAGAIQLGPSTTPMLHLWLPEPVSGFEVRVYSRSGRPYPPMTFGGLHLIRRASMTGLHRTENMNLLVHLVAMRMQYAARTERMMDHAAD